MKHRAFQWSLIILALAGIMVLGACKKKVTPAPPPPPPPPAAPTASLTANPNTIQQGQSTSLTWETQNATDVTLDGNKVDANGSQTVSPTDSTTYHLLAKGAGGSQESTARVTVTPPPAPVAKAPSPTEMDLFNSNVKDVYFDYDSYDIKPDQQSIIQGERCFPEAESWHRLHHRRSLRRAWIHRVQPRAWRQSCQRGEECSGAIWRRREPYQDHQLRQRKAVLH